MKGMDRKFLDLYSDYLISSFGKVTATGLSELLDGELSHDQITSRLRQITGGSPELWYLVKPTIRKHESEEGVLIFDDTLEHKPYSDENTIVGWYFDHSSNRSVKGINILNCIYHNEAISLPVAFEIVQKLQEVTDPKTGKTKFVSEESKNEMMRNMLHVCCQNRLKFSYVLADSWFSSKENMQYIKLRVKKDFIIALSGNRLVALSPDDKCQGHFVNLESIELNPDSCCKVFLKGLDFPVSITKQVFRNKNQSTGILYLACSNLDLIATDINTIYQKRWKVEEFHKSLKSNLSLAKSPTGIAHTQKNHIFACFFAFVKLERLRIKTKLNHFALKAKLYLNAIRASFSLLQKLTVPST
jgi:hypothetical protein